MATAGRLIYSISGAGSIGRCKIGKVFGEFANIMRPRHVTRAEFDVSILTLSALHLKLFLKSIS
jgi:hypothetical protein